MSISLEMSRLIISLYILYVYLLQKGYFAGDKHIREEKPFLS